MSKTLVIIPTYNESQNIEKIITMIEELEIGVSFLIIDDNSPDKTYDIVKNIMNYNDKVNLIVQNKKSGLGTAYKKGFKWAIDNNYDKIIQIDADLSHDPKTIPDLIQVSNQYDLVIGSRYIDGINVINWPMSRLLLSYFANRYVRFLTRLKINDSTSGYKCISTNVLKAISLDKIKSQGYSFQIEVNFLASIKGFKIKEIPIIFHDRTVGESKMSKSIIIEAIFMVPKLALKRIFRIW
tara:strand:- start:345 stop:1061 length:717 start_codon:yes stop_codon:yes gene_type:complete